MAEETAPNNGTGGSSSRFAGGRTDEECQDMIRRSLRTPTVKFLKEQMEKAGCVMGENFIKAVHCDKQISGGYARGQGIMVCSNHMNIQDEVNQVVIHELIHAYDDCRAANLDWSNCAHHACSEIRAGHLSGDCHYKRELLRGYMKIRGHEQGMFGPCLSTNFVLACGRTWPPDDVAHIYYPDYSFDELSLDYFLLCLH